MRTFLLAAAVILFCCAIARADGFVVRDTRIFDGNEVFDGSVRVEGDRIVAVARAPKTLAPRNGETIIDGRGKTLLPGLIDAHVHWAIKEETSLAQNLRFGVTTVLDMFGPAAVARELRAQEGKPDAPLQADVRTAGTLATAPQGHGTEYGIPIPTIARAAEAEHFVAVRLDEGSDYLKIVYDHQVDPKTKTMMPTLSLDVLRALIGAAHAHGRLAVVHIGLESDALDVARAGADGLAHSFQDAPASPELIAALVANHTFVVATMTMQTLKCGLPARAFAADPRIASRLWNDDLKLLKLVKMGDKRDDKCLARLDANILAMHKAGVPILVGTDAANWNTAYGASVHHELELLVHAGLSPLDALRGATSDVARAFRLDDRGVIRVGALADLVLVDGDPSTEITATRNLLRVWKRGRAASLALPPPPTKKN